MDTYHNTPAQMPEAGYYYHYKHDPAKGVYDYAYYIYGAGNCTEDLPQELAHLQHWQVYKPLYESFVYRTGKRFDLRPLHMFFEPAMVEDREVPRFTRITDPAVLSALKVRRREMYKEEYADWQ